MDCTRLEELTEKPIDNLYKTLLCPDYIIEDKHKDTGLVVKRLDEKKGILKSFCAYALLGMLKTTKIRLFRVGKLRCNHAPYGSKEMQERRRLPNDYLD